MDRDKTKAQLIAELAELRQRVSALDAQVARSRQAEEAFRQSDQRLSLHFQRTPLGAIEWDLEFRVTRWNPGAERIFGYSPEEALGRHASFVVPPSVREHVDRIWNGLLARKSGERSTNENVTKDGRTILCEWYNTSLVDADGRVIGVASLVEDITERIRAEEALQKAHDQLEDKVSERTAELAIFHRFAEAAGQGFGMADMDGIITYMNPALCRIAGVEKPEDAVGTHLTAYYPEEYSLRRETEIIPALLQEDHWEGEVVLSSGGRTITALQHSFLIRDGEGNPSHLASVVTDITQRKQDEEALRTSEERFRSYFVQGLIGMAVSTVDKRWSEVNDRLCEILGYRREELLEMKWTEATHPDDVKRGVEQFGRLSAGQIDHYTQEKRFIRKDGGVVYTNIFVRCFRRDDGTVDHFLTLIEDITERKRAQDELERERRSLWNMLQASDHERQIISYDIHDGLAQYLAAARMQLQVFDGLRESDPEEAKKACDAAIQLVSESHREARRLISEVRPPVIDEVGLETAISHLIHEHRRRGGPKIEYRGNVQFDRLTSVLENALYRIVQEALTNACKHSESKEVTVTLAQEGQDVRLEVRDGGIGFDPQSVGTGHFGLEGIRQRVRLLGGRLNIESKPGSGTLVQVVVPLVERQIEG